MSEKTSIPNFVDVKCKNTKIQDLKLNIPKDKVYYRGTRI